MKPVKPPEWKSRITGYSEEDPEQLLANPANWRIHPKAQQDALNGTIAQAGFVDPVKVNDRTGHLLDGHLRVTLAMRENDERAKRGLAPFLIPVAHLDLDPGEESLILATFDPISAMAARDQEQLDELLREIETGEPALQAMLAELAEKAGITPPNVSFKEYDESIENEVEYITCPECGHKWPK